MKEKMKNLFYCIDILNKNVIFVKTEDDGNSWESILKEQKIIMSFNEVLRNITDFRDNDLFDLKKRTDDLIEIIHKEKKTFKNMLEGYNVQSSKIFTNYYSVKLKDVFELERKKFSPMINVIRVEHTRNDVETKIHKFLNRIIEIVQDDWEFDISSETVVRKVNNKNVFIRTSEQAVAYTFADDVLENFFYDFRHAIYNLKLYVCTCKYCNKIFLGMKNAVCCNGEECQATYQRDMKNEKRRAKEKDIYNVHMSKLTTYLSQHTYNLKNYVQGDKRYVEKFKSRNSEFKGRLKDEIERCRAENIIPGDEQDAFLEKLEAEIFRYRLQIEDEWRTEQKNS